MPDQVRHDKFGIFCEINKVLLCFIRAIASGEKAARLINAKNLKEKANIEPQNIECRRKECCRFYLKGQSEAIPSFEIQYSLFSILRFALEVSHEPAPLAAGLQSDQKKKLMNVEL